MIKLKDLLWGICVFPMLFTSCSMEEEKMRVQNKPNSEIKTASLSFRPVLNDLVDNNDTAKQVINNNSDCSGALPSYAMVVLSSEEQDGVGTQEDPLRIELGSDPVSNPTVPELQLPPGTYSLDYYMAFNDEEEVVWFAPNGQMGDFLNNPLPITIELNEGSTKYVDVSALCFDSRTVNENGYMFFEIEKTEAIEFCIFGNYCDETGRHFPAEFSVSVWNYSDDQPEDLIVSDLRNTVALDENGDYAGTTICLNLPDGEAPDEYYFEITILNSDAYEDVEEEIIRSGVITEENVKDLFDGDDKVDYFHFREGCSGEDTPALFEEITEGE